MPRLRGAAPTPPPPPDPCVGVQQQTARTDGAGCLLYAHRPPRCVYHDDKQVAGPCNFDVASLSCTYAEAATITLAAAAPPVAPGTVASATAAPPEACGMRAAVAQAVAALRPLQVCGRSALPPPQQPARQQQRQQEQQQQQQQMPRVHPSGAGSWLPPSAAAASPGWRPSVAFRAPPPSITCPPEVIGAAGLVGWAQATGIRRIVMSGDSTMRQASVGRLWSKPALRIRGCSWHMCLHIVVWPPACRCPPARPPTYYPPACWPAGRPAFLLALLARSTAAVLRALPAPPRPLPACPPAHPPALSLPCSFSSAWSLYLVLSQRQWMWCLSATPTTPWAGPPLPLPMGRKPLWTASGSARTPTPQSCALTKAKSPTGSARRMLSWWDAAHQPRSCRRGWPVGSW